MLSHKAPRWRPWTAALEDEEDIEEVDLADLAVIRAKVDAAEPQVVSRDGIIQEAFTGMCNQCRAQQMSSTGCNSRHRYQYHLCSTIRLISNRFQTYLITNLSYTIEIQL